MNVFSNNPTWNNPPELILVEILSYLNLNDRRNASLVNRKWAEGFRHPSLWRRVNVVFYGDINNARSFLPTITNHHAQKFAANLGGSVRILNVTVTSPDRTRTRRIQTELDLFLRRMIQQECNLEELNIDCCFAHKDWAVTKRKEMIDSLKHFLDTQYSLRKVVLQIISRHDDIGLLESIIDTSGSSVRHLECIFNNGVNPGPSTFAIMYSISSAMPYLHTLTLAVQFVDDTLIKGLCKNCQSLKSLEIVALSANMKIAHSESASWRHLRKTHPQLKMKFHGFFPKLLSKFPEILLPGMPLVSIMLFINASFWEANWNIKRCLDYIGDTFSSTLETFALGCGIGANRYSLDSLPMMVSNCTKLKYVIIKTELGIIHIKEIAGILKDRENSRLELHKLRFWFSDKEKLVHLLNEYQNIVTVDCRY